MYKKITIKDLQDFFYLSDGKNILSIEKNKSLLVPKDTYIISTVHKPNTKTGTGYRLTEYATLDKSTIDEYLPVIYPNWADRRDISSVVKYKDLEEFLAYTCKQWGNNITIEDLAIN